MMTTFDSVEPVEEDLHEEDAGERRTHLSVLDGIDALGREQ
jgi:hypothetical protein